MEDKISLKKDKMKQLKIKPLRVKEATGLKDQCPEQKSSLEHARKKELIKIPLCSLV
jgi:hypothetical protein